MVFSSLEFLFLYLPVVFILYFAVPKKYLKVKNIVLLIVSLFFYGWGEPVYVLLMIFTIIVNFICGYFVVKFKEKNKSIARLFLVLSIVLSVGILGFFKYYDFVVNSLHIIPALQGLKTFKLNLPIGISFYTFQAMSYTIDVYRDDAKIQKNIVNFGVYVTFFPQLIAGPIVRYQDIADALSERVESVSLFAEGVRTFLAGLGKKILFANMAGQIWNNFKIIPDNDRTLVGCWFGIICFTFQIYFDFSGYSDMAIGIGKMFGFKFSPNFNYPYMAKSITDFWRRWHISLSLWFRNYVYIPLGGNRCSKTKMYRNLFIVWFLTGLWHGASWNFIIWGMYFFILLVTEKVFLLKTLKKIPNIIQHIYALFFIVFGWFIFAFCDIENGLGYLKKLFGVDMSSVISKYDIYEIKRNLLFLMILCFACTPVSKKIFDKYTNKNKIMQAVVLFGGVACFLICIAYLVNSSFNPFLYFRF